MTEETTATPTAAATAPAPSPASDAAPASYRAICFDLDGTLLPLDLDEFLGRYYEAITAKMAENGVNVDEFRAALDEGIRAMLSHDSGQSNAEAFWSHFFTLVDEGARDWYGLFMDFYDHEFGDIGSDVVANPAAAEVVATLTEKGYPLVLTTMPMFPPQAVNWRLAWAGVDPNSFARITTFDNSTAVKPQSAYYAENLAAMGVTGSDVLMVGNNTVEDLSFAKLGADTYLVTDCLLNPDNLDVSTTRHGTLAEFAQWAQSLPYCETPATSIDNGLMDWETTEEALVVNERAAMAKAR